MGELRILRENSLDEAMTMKLAKELDEVKVKDITCQRTNILKTLMALRAPESHCFL